MSEQEHVIDLDRLDVIGILHERGKSFTEMVPTIQGLGLLTCQESHHKRPLLDGTPVCTTCANTLLVQWRRYLAKLGDSDIDVDETKGAWLHAHAEVYRICRQRCVQEIAVETTRTEYVTTPADAAAGTPATTAEVVTRTVRKETRVNTSLLRLSLEVRDKMLRMAGVDLDDPDVLEPVPRGKVHVNRARGAAPVN